MFSCCFFLRAACFRTKNSFSMTGCRQTFVCIYKTIYFLRFEKITNTFVCFTFAIKICQRTADGIIYSEPGPHYKLNYLYGIDKKNTTRNLLGVFKSTAKMMVQNISQGWVWVMAHESSSSKGVGVKPLVILFKPTIFCDSLRGNNTVKSTRFVEVWKSKN